MGKLDPVDQARFDAHIAGCDACTEFVAQREFERQVTPMVQNAMRAHNAAVVLKGDPALIQLGEQEFLGRLQSYLELAPALHGRVADIDSVDLRFDGRIYVRPVGKTARAGMLVRRAKP